MRQVHSPGKAPPRVPAHLCGHFPSTITVNWLFFNGRTKGVPFQLPFVSAITSLMSLVFEQPLFNKVRTICGRYSGNWQGVISWPLRSLQPPNSLRGYSYRLLLPLLWLKQKWEKSWYAVSILYRDSKWSLFTFWNLRRVLSASYNYISVITDSGISVIPVITNITESLIIESLISLTIT